MTPSAATHSPQPVLPSRPARSQTGKPGTRGGEDVALVEQVDRADHEPGDAQPAGQDPAAQDDHADGDRPGDGEQLAEVLAEQRPAELVLRGPRRRRPRPG